MCEDLSPENTWQSIGRWADVVDIINVTGDKLEWQCECKHCTRQLITEASVWEHSCLQDGRQLPRSWGKYLALLPCSQDSLCCEPVHSRSCQELLVPLPTKAFNRGFDFLNETNIDFGGGVQRRGRSRWEDSKKHWRTSRRKSDPAKLSAPFYTRSRFCITLIIQKKLIDRVKSFGPWKRKALQTAQFHLHLEPSSTWCKTWPSFIYDWANEEIYPENAVHGQPRSVCASF